MHVATSESHSLSLFDYKMPELSQPDGCVTSKPFWECRDVLGCCSTCLTDWTTTIEHCMIQEASFDVGSMHILSLDQCG